MRTIFSSLFGRSKFNKLDTLFIVFSVMRLVKDGQVGKSHFISKHFLLLYINLNVIFTLTLNKELSTILKLL